MYLTRLELDTSKRNTYRALSQINHFHGAVEAAFEGERKRTLWRIDELCGRQYLMLLSEDKPNLEKAKAQFSKSEVTWLTKDYDPLLDRIQKGDVWQFRLCACPTYSKPRGYGKRGQVLALTTEEEQKQWLKRQADKFGFQVEDSSFDVVKTQWYRFEKGTTKHQVSMFTATYEGILKITNTEVFKEMLVKGIGREKAYGAGLMTLMRCPEGMELAG